MEQRQLRAVWLGGFGAIIVAPSLLWFLTVPQGSMLRHLSVVTGLLALSALVAAVVLPSRIRSLNRAFGIENVLDLHRFLGAGTAVLTLLHLACVLAANPANVVLLDLPSAPARARSATGATIALVAIVVMAVLRRQSKLTYELWRWTHVALAAVTVVLTALHVWFLDQLVRDAVVGPLLGLFAAVVVVVTGYRWVWRALYDSSTEFRVREIRQENPTVSTLVLEPRQGRHGSSECWAFAPGQFAWLRLDRSVTAQEHPFTIASSAHDGCTEFTIRHAGDFTRAIRRLPPGAPVWVDGPHGAFTNDVGECSGFVLVAGGVGITPMMSMIRTAAHRGDPRPYRLVVVASAPEDLLFRTELAQLRHYIDLEVTEVLRRPHSSWSGRTGGIDTDLMGVVLAGVEQVDDLDYFICGPPAMVSDAMGVLDEMGVPPVHVHTEQFDFV